jgi:hypothetical protein
MPLLADGDTQAGNRNGVWSRICIILGTTQIWAGEFSRPVLTDPLGPG